MKKICFLITILISLLGLSIIVYAETPIDEFEYEVVDATDDYVKITGYTGTDSELAIPSQIEGKPVKVIGEAAFKSFGDDNKDNITSITIPNSVGRIGEDAFQSCDGLVTVTIENGYKNSEEEYQGLRYINEDAFNDCDNLTTINFPNVVEIDGIKHGLVSIGKSAFAGCDKLNNVILPDTIRTLEDSIFYNCTDLDNITLPSNQNVTTIGNNMFRNCTSLNNITFPGNIKYIGSNAFEGCISLDNMDFNKVQVINNDAFKNCSSLGSSGLEISLSVDSIGISAFENCDSITELTFERYCDIQTISHYAFRDCDNLTKFKFPITVKTLGEGAFESCDKLQEADISLPGRLITVEKNMFKNCSNLTSVKLRLNKVTTIKTSAFEGCSSLQSIDLPDQLTSIEAGAFLNCSKINNITLPSGITKIEYNVFNSCTSLDTLTFEGTDIEIGSNAFYKTGFSSINSLLTNVSSIGNSAFFDCNGLTSVTIPDTVMSIGDYVFNHCDNLSNVKIMGDDTTIGKQIFKNCPNLTNVKLPNNLTDIGEKLFINCQKLNSIVIPNSVTSIGKEAFANCKSLTSITLPDGLQTIEDVAFNGSDNITEISLPSSVGKIGRHSFNNMTKLKKITVLNPAMTFHDNAIENCHADLAIHGYANSTAQTYADKDSVANDETDLIDFVLLSTSPTNTPPIVANEIPDQKANIGEMYNYQFPQNTFTDSNSDILTYSVNTTPTGITFDSDTRSFSGNPTTEETMTITVTANDGNGGTATDTFNFTVIKAPLISGFKSFDITKKSGKVRFTVDEDVDYRIVVKKSSDPFDNREFNIGEVNGVIHGNATANTEEIVDITTLRYGGGAPLEAGVEHTVYLLITDRDNNYMVHDVSFTTLSDTPTNPNPKPSNGGSGGSSSSRNSKSPLEKAIDKAEKNDDRVKEVLYEVKTDKKGKAKIELPDNFVGERVDLTLKADDVNITLNGKMFKSDDKSVELEIKPRDLDGLKLSKEAENQIGDNPVYDISLKINGKAIEFKTNQSIEISFKLNSKLDSHKFIAIYIDENGNVKILKDSFFDGKTIKLSTNHLSNYGVMYVDKTFKDSISHWGKEAIEALVARNITNGTSKTTFSPNNTITRAEFVTLITRYFDLESDDTTSYIDVEAGKWYTKSVATAKALGLLPTIYGTQFKPNEAITREDMMFILHKALVVTAKADDLSDKGKSLDGFDDKNNVSDYAAESAEYLVSRDIIHGYGSVINPTDTSTRAEVAQMLYNLIKMFKNDTK